MLAFLIILPSSCMPIYRTDYTYQPPNTEFGRGCINPCLANKTQCRHECNSLHYKCKSLDNSVRRTDNAVRHTEHIMNSLNGHNNRISNQHRTHKPLQASHCDSDNNRCIKSCDEYYNSCYMNCGGQVLEKKYCIANCK